MIRSIDLTGSVLGRGDAYKTPMLIASATPIFSLVCMLRFMMIFQGMMASTKSMTPEYADRKERSVSLHSQPTMCHERDGTYRW